MRKLWLASTLILSVTIVGCNSTGRYVLVSESVAGAGAGTGGDSRPETETIRGRVYRLDTKTGDVILISSWSAENEKGEAGILSLRVFSPSETFAILSRRKAASPTAVKPAPTPSGFDFDEFLKTYATPKPSPE
jgi:hypothetical protein